MSVPPLFLDFRLKQNIFATAAVCESVRPRIFPAFVTDVADVRSGGTLSLPDSGIKEMNKKKKNKPESVCGFYPGQSKRSSYE